jgi:folate-binding protein YgfZ
VSTLLPNPLIEIHRRWTTVETQPYDSAEIVTTFGDAGREYAAIYESCGLMDVPQRGVLELTGKDRHVFLNNLVSNTTWDKSTKQPMPTGTGVYAYFLNLRGRIVADMNVLELGDRTFVETDARKVELLRTVWDKYLFVEKVVMTSRIGALHELSLFGPKAADVLMQATGSRVELDAPLSVTTVKLLGVACAVFRDDVCGVPGFHVLVPSESVEWVWTTLADRFGYTDTGKHMLRPVGWAAFNAARIEAGRLLLDVDIPSAASDRPGAKLNPVEAVTAAAGQSTPGAGVLPAETGQADRAVAYTKCYVGQEIVARMHARNVVAKQLVGIRMASDALPIAGATIFDANDNAIGAVTSSTVSPMLDGVAICMGFVKKPHFAVGTTVHIPADGAMRTGTVIGLPFVTAGATHASPFLAG